MGVTGAVSSLPSGSNTVCRFRLSINLSLISFQNLNLATLIAQQLQHSGLQPVNLCVEVTEGVLLSETLGAEQAIRIYTHWVVRLAIDDFGTGYSSLGYLRHLPISELKLDKSFVDDPEHDKSRRALSESVLAICRGLSLHVDAEGIEHAVQYDILKAQGYKIGQGNYFQHRCLAGSWNNGSQCKSLIERDTQI